MARLLEERILDRDRHAVVIAGLAHVERAPEPSARPNVTQTLDRVAPGEVYVAGVHLGFPRESRWETPSIADLTETWIGLLPKGAGRAQDALDAMLYLGPPDALHLSAPMPDVYVRADYWQELRRRWELQGVGDFSAEVLFAAYSNAGYPGLFDAESVLQTTSITECMRTHGVEQFPRPQFQYDAVGFYGEQIRDAEEDPDFQGAEKACISASPGP